MNSLFSEAKSELLDAIKNHQEFLTDPERNQGRLNKEDKVISIYKLAFKKSKCYIS